MLSDIQHKQMFQMDLLISNQVFSRALEEISKLSQNVLRFAKRQKSAIRC